MVIKKKLSELTNGDAFEWKGWRFKKTGPYTAVRQDVRETWMFKRTEIVQHLVPDAKQDAPDEDDWHNYQWFNHGIIP